MIQKFIFRCNFIQGWSLTHKFCSSIRMFIIGNIFRAPFRWMNVCVGGAMRKIPYESISATKISRLFRRWNGFVIRTNRSKEEFSNSFFLIQCCKSQEAAAAFITIRVQTRKHLIPKRRKRKVFIAYEAELSEEGNHFHITQIMN